MVSVAPSAGLWRTASERTGRTGSVTFSDCEVLAMTTLTIQDLIQHFEHKLRQIDRQNYNGTGSEPQFPQLVIYLGRDARAAHRSVSANLLQTWPQYQQELKFLWAQADGENLSFYELACGGDQAMECSEDGVRDIASSLFGTRMHFSDRGKLLVYYILDTTGFQSKEDFLAWLPQIRKIKSLLCANSTDMLDVLLLLLNENLVRQKTAAQIRDYMSGFYQGSELKKSVGSILLLSNRRNDNAILEDWEICYQILSAAIVLSNNEDPRITSSFFCGDVMTASYAREEKPLPKIGQDVVKNLIDELSKAAPQNDVKLLDDAGLPARLGMTKQGTLALLDAYAENSLSGLLPTEEQLEFFPRRDSGAQMSMASMSAKNFNEYTMGAWEQYLGRIVKTAREKLSMDASVRAYWRSAYQEQLTQQFSRGEILYLASHLQDVEKLMTQPKPPGQEAQVLSAARDQLKYMLSSDRQTVEIFLSALQDQGRMSQAFEDMWSDILRSMRKVYPHKDKNITEFYNRKVRNYFDRHGRELLDEFSAMHDTAELDRFLKSALDRIADSDDIFSAAFEDELESRLNEEAQSMDAKQYIREKLTGSEVYVYLQTNFDLGVPLISSILLKAGTPLYANLYSNLSPATYYYDTGSGTTAEALVIYRVSAENLVNGGEV